MVRRAQPHPNYNHKRGQADWKSVAMDTKCNRETYQKQAAQYPKARLTRREISSDGF